MASLPIFLSILEKSNVSPSTASHDTSLALTFMDIPHISMPPVHFVLFYQLPALVTKTEFIETIVAKLKHSLSITLQHFLPFAGNLILYPTSTTTIPEIRYVEGDSVKVTSAECNLDFDDLTGYHPRNCYKFHHLIPLLGDFAKISDYLKRPVFSVQLTLFPNCGFSIGVTFNHCLADSSALFCFLNAWISIAQCGTDESFLANGTLPFYERVVNYPERDKSALVDAKLETLVGKEYQPPKLSGPDDNKVRSTFVLTRTSIQLLKKLVSTTPVPYVSAFTVTCAYIWSCLAKARNENEHQGFMFGVDVRSRLDPPVPASYIGNCINTNVTNAKTSVLAGKEGFINAAKLIGENLHQMLANKDKDGILADKFSEQIRSGGWPKTLIGIFGSPKLRFYDLDFGWGKPRKFEIVSMDYHFNQAGALLVPLDGGKQSDQDMEISVCLTPTQMETFDTAFNKGLETLI